MKLKDVLERVNRETFRIHDYTKIVDPIRYHIKNAPQSYGALPLINTNNYLTEDDKNDIFWKTVNNIIDQTYNAIASDDVVSCVYFSSKAVFIQSLRYLVDAVCTTVVGDWLSSYDNSDSKEFISYTKASIITIKVEDSDDFNFENVLKLIEVRLKSNTEFKIILIGGSESVNNRIVPVLNKYASLYKERK